MACSSTLGRFFQKYYLLNYLTILSYVAIRLFADKNLFFQLKSTETWTTLPREVEIGLSVLVVLVARYRSAPTLDHYVNTAVLFLKSLVIIYMSFVDKRYMVWYLIAYLVMFLSLKGARYNGPHQIMTFLAPKDLEEIVTGNNANGDVDWLIAACADWNPAWHNFLPTFAELSLRYTTEKVRFGCIDVAQYPELAEVYKINIGGMSNQLPSFLLFENKKETRRLPPLNSKGKVVKTLITKEGLIQVFQLDKRVLGKATTSKDKKN
jgi:hypothetical protein